MKIAIVDDENVFREQIEQEIMSFYGALDTLCYHFTDGDEFLASLEKGVKYDAVFLDIEMKRKDGMTTAKAMRFEGCSIPVIFVTSHVEMAMDGYHVQAFRFLAKPLDKVRLREVLRDLEKELEKNVVLLLGKDGEERVVSLDAVIYMESANTDVRYILPDDVIQTRGKLADAIKEVSELSNQFYQIHRCCVINLKNVARFTKDTVTMVNGDALAIAKRSQSAFRKVMFEYVKRNGR